MRTKFSHRDARHYLKYGIILFFFTKMPPKLNQNGLWEYNFLEFCAIKYKCVKNSVLKFSKKIKFTSKLGCTVESTIIMKHKIK